MKKRTFITVLIILFVVIIVALCIKYLSPSAKHLKENSLTISKNLIESDSFDYRYPAITLEYLEKRNEEIANNKFVNYEQYDQIEIGMKSKKVLKIMEVEPNEIIEIIDGSISDYVWYSSKENENFNIYFSDDKVVYKKQTTVVADTNTEPSLDYSGITSSSGKTLEEINEEISETEEKLNQTLNRAITN